MPVGETTICRPEYVRDDLPECVEHNVKANARDNTGQNTDERHTQPVPGEKLKFLVSPGIESGLRVLEAGTLLTTPRRQTHSFSQNVKTAGF